MPPRASSPPTRGPRKRVVRGDGFTVGGMAKGCGMLAPNMATMLAFLTTDAALTPAELQPILARATDATFNCLITDGATSTNDTVMLFASGRRGRPDLAAFEDAVRQVCEELMLQMARDAEGMTKLVVIRVTGAASDAEARKVARSIGNNQLIKCSWYGADAYWGRLLAEAGSCGVAFDTETSAVVVWRDPRRRGGGRNPPRCRRGDGAHARAVRSTSSSSWASATASGARCRSTSGRATSRKMRPPHEKRLMINTNETARLLIEALPYIRRFTGKVVVVKVGGLPMTDPDARAQPGQGRAAAPFGRHPPGAGPWRRAADRRPDGAPGQDRRADRRPARHRRRGARHRPHGAGRQDQPRAGQRGQRARAGRGRGGGRRRAPARGEPGRSAAGLRRQGRQGPRRTAPRLARRRADPDRVDGRRRRRAASRTTSTPTTPRARSRWRWAPRN